MKTTRNTLLLALWGIVLALLAVACHKDCDLPRWENGIMLGVDYRECVCCGGWFIEIDGDTLRAQVLPEEFARTLNEDAYPLPVRLRWERDPTPCLGDEIEVLEIRRR